MSTDSHDPILKLCMQCSQMKPVPAERADEYRKAHAGEAFRFICKECAARDQDEARVAGGTVENH